MNIDYKYLQGKFALITGSSRGIGKGIALKLAERGANIAVNYIQNEDAAKQTLEEIRKRGADGLYHKSGCIKAGRSKKPDAISLFGSIVREDFNASSDIDIIVQFTKPVGIEFIDLANFIESKLDKKIDLVSRNGIKANYFQQIESEIIYV